MEDVSDSGIMTKEENENKNKFILNKFDCCGLVKPVHTLIAAQVGQEWDKDKKNQQNLGIFCKFEKRKLGRRLDEIKVIASVTKRELGEGRL